MVAKPPAWVAGVQLTEELLPNLSHLLDCGSVARQGQGCFVAAVGHALLCASKRRCANAPQVGCAHRCVWA